MSGIWLRRRDVCSIPSGIKNELLFLFIGGVVLSFLVSLATGFVLEKIFHKNGGIIPERSSSSEVM